jgi:hypothetical protein
VAGVGCQVSGVGCRVSGVGCQVSGVGCRVSGVRCRVSGVSVWDRVSGVDVGRRMSVIPPQRPEAAMRFPSPDAGEQRIQHPGNFAVSRLQLFVLCGRKVAKVPCELKPELCFVGAPEGDENKPSKFRARSLLPGSTFGEICANRLAGAADLTGQLVLLVLRKALRCDELLTRPHRPCEIRSTPKPTPSPFQRSVRPPLLTPRRRLIPESRNLSADT